MKCHEAEKQNENLCSVIKRSLKCIMKEENKQQNCIYGVQPSVLKKVSAINIYSYLLIFSERTMCGCLTLIYWLLPRCPQGRDQSLFLKRCYCFLPTPATMRWDGHSPWIVCCILLSASSESSSVAGICASPTRFQVSILAWQALWIPTTLSDLLLPDLFFSR